MPRQTFVHFPGALYHITARGNDKREIFLEARDYQRYLANLAKCKQKIDFHLYSFVLMPNHLHLLIEVDKYPVSKIMQILQTGYTMYFNKKYSHTGHLFQGRYHHLLVDKDNYLLELIRYIHLNSVRAGLVKDIDDYLWSSHSSLIDRTHKFNDFMERDYVLAQFSSRPNKQIEDYRDFVYSGMEKQWEEISPDIAWGYILGKDKYVCAVEKKLRKKMIQSSRSQQ